MNDIEKNNVYYVCALIEYIGRTSKNTRKDIINKIGIQGLKDIYDLAEVYHCLTFEEVSTEIIQKHGIQPRNL